MYEKLIKLVNNAYAPYSNYHVASIIKMKDGKEFSGVNVENASFGATICAERSAIISAVSNGYKKGDFDSLYVMCADSDKISTCCFLCRQVISEFFEKDAKIICYDKKGNTKEYSVSEICTYPFGAEDLK